MKTEALLTPQMLTTLKPKRREYTLFDAQCPKLSVRVQPSGAKSWVTWERSDGTSRRVTLGKLNAMSPDQARAAVRGDDAGGFQPSATCPTFEAVATAFLAAKQDVYRPSTLRSLRQYLDGQLLPAFGALRADRITTPVLAAWFHEYSATRPGGANQALLHVTTILNWGKATGLLPHGLPNPAQPLKRNRRMPRGQMLSSEDLARLFAVLSSPPDRCEDGARIVELILLTGCRSGEILRLRWDEVHADRLELSQTKTGARTVLLNDPAIAALSKLKRWGAFVFPSPVHPGEPRTQIDSQWRKIKARADLPSTLRLHDLRHTYASHAILAGESLYATGQLLGHADPQSTQRYAHLSGDALVAAVEKVSGRVAELLVG